MITFIKASSATSFDNSTPSNIIPYNSNSKATIIIKYCVIIMLIIVMYYKILVSKEYKAIIIYIIPVGAMILMIINDYITAHNNLKTTQIILEEFIKKQMRDNILMNKRKICINQELQDQLLSNNFKLLLLVYNKYLEHLRTYNVNIDINDYIEYLKNQPSQIVINAL